jgi:hypothetical protein
MNDYLHERILERNITVIESKEDISSNIKFIKGVSKNDNGDKLRGYEIGTLAVVILDSYADLNPIKKLSTEIGCAYNMAQNLITI